MKDDRVTRRRFSPAGVILWCAVAAGLLAGCEIHDDLEIREDGSGTYRASVVVARLMSPILDRIRAEAKQRGFRVVDEEATLTDRTLTVQKDFKQIREISDSQSNFDLKIENGLFRRIYRLHVTLGAVSGASFDRQFSIKMPADITSASDGRVEGRHVVWFCENGGSIEITAEQRRLPFARILPFVFIVPILGGLIVVIILVLHRQRRSPAPSEVPAVETQQSQRSCRTCRKPLPLYVRYCPSCGDVANFR